MRYLIGIDEPVDPNCAKRGLGACAGEPFFDEQQNTRYCVLHFPGADKEVAFNAALEKKRESKNYNYRGIWFPNDSSFGNLQFEEKTDFSHTVFNGEC